MADTWIVVLGSHLPYHLSAAWGPFATEQEAHDFAAFATREIDPATPMKLKPPAAELLFWRETLAGSKDFSR